MSFSVGLYRDFARKGGPTFRTVPSAQFSDLTRFAKTNQIGAHHAQSEHNPPR